MGSQAGRTLVIAAEASANHVPHCGVGDLEAHLQVSANIPQHEGHHLPQVPCRLTQGLDQVHLPTFPLFLSS